MCAQCSFPHKVLCGLQVWGVAPHASRTAHQERERELLPHHARTRARGRGGGGGGFIAHFPAAARPITHLKTDSSAELVLLSR